MPIHIHELTANVTLTEGTVGQTNMVPPVAEAIVPSSEELTPLEMVVSEMTPPSAGDRASGSAAGQPSGNAAGAPPVAVDPAALYERVYRMMLDDLLIARERE